jgi:exonuclease SbcD
MPDRASSESFCFVHAADLHLDSPCKGMEATAPHVASALRDASLHAFSALVDLAIARRAAFVLFAGDIYDGAERGLRAQLAFRDGLERLSQAGISSFIVHGNHDPVDEGWTAVSSWPPGVHFFSSEGPEAVEVERHDQVIATVQGMSYPQREVTENLALGFRRRDKGLQIGLLHCNVAGTADGYAAYSPCSLEELRQVGLDYWALGHIHQTAVLSGRPGGGEPFVVYPGNLQARSRKPSEQGPKGAMVVEVEAGQVAKLEHVACDQIRFVSPVVEISELGSLADLHEQLAGLAGQLVESAGQRSVVVHAKLVGRGGLHKEIVRAGVLDDLLGSLRSECPVEVPFVWWDRLVDETAPPLDLDALARADDFSADLLRTASGLKQALELEELCGKMPTELKKLADEILQDVGLAEVIEQSCLMALDKLEVGQ